jgi:branched-chain amino acid transport system substrate-binding protein
MFRLALALLALSTAGVARAQDSPVPPLRAPARPFRDFRQQATPYAGPGRERSEAADVSEVLLGYFGPSDPDHPDGGDLWKAAELAVSQANAQGGYKGKPFRLVAAWSDDPWKAGVAGIARMVYRDRVWAIVGGTDGPTAHLAEQVVVKARLPLVCPTSSDRSANMANVPWMFSVLPGDHLQAPILAAVLTARSGRHGYSFLSSPDHDSRLFLAELERALKRQQSAPRFTHVLAPSDPEIGAVVRQVVSDDVSAVVIAAGAAESAHFVRELRAAGFRGLILGGHSMGRRQFLAAAGPAAEGVLFPLLCEPAAMPASFRLEFEQRYRVPPDYAAASTYDALNLLIAAIRRGGLNRAKIADALGEVSPYSGVTGTIAWDKLGSNTRPVVLGTTRAGQVVSFEGTNAGSK